MNAELYSVLMFLCMGLIRELSINVLKYIDMFRTLLKLLYMADRIDKVDSRNKLKPRTAPYWQKVSGGCALGFRKMTKQSAGTWLAQFYDSSTKKQIRQSLGSFSELQPNLRFDQAKKKAELFFCPSSNGLRQMG